MTTENRIQPRTNADASRLNLGGGLVALAGLGLVLYGVAFLVRNFTGFIELGLTSQLVGGTTEQIRDFSSQLFAYIGHLNVAVSGFIIALGVTVIGLGWYGIRRGEGWAL